ncbi:hypothetical protein PO909_021137 [Leuciscus waleckii]
MCGVTELGRTEEPDTGSQHPVPRNWSAAAPALQREQKKPRRVLLTRKLKLRIQRLKEEIGDHPSLTPPLDPSVSPRTCVFAVPRQQQDPSPEAREPKHPPQRVLGGTGEFSLPASHNARSQPPRGLTGHAPVPNTSHKACVYPHP